MAKRRYLQNGLYLVGDAPLFPSAFPWSDRHKKRLFVIGAGFSRALHADMPLAEDLKGALQARGLGKAITTGNLETSLAFLASQHPFDRGSESYVRLALLSDVLQGIAEEIAEHSAIAMERLPEWLVLLKKIWMTTSSRVVSFNYDLLIEADNSVRSRGRSVDLHKPHGSLDLTWRPNVPASIERCDGTLATIKLNFQSGKVPFVVPPTTAKSSYYGVDALAQPWHVFRESLETADEVVLLGFSMAEADATVTGLMASAKSTEFVVADFDDKSLELIGGRLERVGLQMKHRFSGVQNYVENGLLRDVVTEAFHPSAVLKHVRNWKGAASCELDWDLKYSVKMNGNTIENLSKSPSGPVAGGDPVGKYSIRELLEIFDSSPPMIELDGHPILDWELTSPNGEIQLIA